MLRKRIKIVLLILISLICMSGAFANSPLPFESFSVEGQMPVTEVFRVEQNTDALDFNLVDSRNSIVRVGSYTLVSNNSGSQFRLSIKPGEDGLQEQFAFVLDDQNNLVEGQLSELPFSVQVSSSNSRAISIKGAHSMEKSLGVRGAYSDNDMIVYETGDILAEIPDFNPDLYATGWYSAAIQLSIEVI